MKLAAFLALIFLKSLFLSGVGTKTTNKEMIANSSEVLKLEEEQETHDSIHFKSFTATYSRVFRNNSSTDLTNSTIRITSMEPKVALGKKPIPKFSATDSEEDYQTKTNHYKLLDSVEHEDENFSIDDFDFDVHNDEFAGRGKPLQPRIKVKTGSRVKSKSKEISKRKIILPRNINVYKDDSVEMTPASQQKSVSDTSDYISKESKGKSSDRTSRSPLSFSEYFKKLSDKTSSLMSKIFSSLPMFPRALESKKLNKP